MKTLLLLTAALALTSISQSAEPTTVVVTHGDGTVHKFIIPPDMEASFSLIRAVRIKRDDKGAVTSEEKNTGELIEGILIETFERAIQQPQFQPPAIKAKVDAANAAITADIETAKASVKAEIEKAKKAK